MATASAVHDLCIGRMVNKIGLLRVSVVPDFPAATLRIKELTKACPGDYVVFDRQTGRVVAKHITRLEFQDGFCG